MKATLLSTLSGGEEGDKQSSRRWFSSFPFLKHLLDAMYSTLRYLW